MNTLWTEQELDAQRAVQLLRFAHTDTYADIRSGAAAEIDDLSEFVQRMDQTSSDLTAVLAWHDELSGSDMPRAGQHFAVYLNTQLLCIRTVDSISDYSRRSGRQSITVVARARDAFPAWRKVARTTRSYPIGTELGKIADDVADSVGLAEGENAIGSIGVAAPQSSTQLSQMSAWEMLEHLLFPAGLSPMVDATGRLKSYNRNLFHASDITLTDERLLGVNASKSRSALTRLLLKWRSPDLVMVSQQDRMLGSATITAGFFQLVQRQTVWFSEDHTQRATGVRWVTKQSANGGLIPICEESWSLETIDSGEVVGAKMKLRTYVFVPTLIVTLIPSLIALAAVPDPTTETRIASAAVTVSIMTLMASIGTGVYEVWGSPYDFVNPINQTEAYDPDASDQLENVETIETDFAHDEAHAQTIVQREFVYRSRAAQSLSITIVDDPRIEVGDIIETAAGERVFVLDYSRPLSPGSAAELEITGFPA